MRAARGSGPEQLIGIVVGSAALGRTHVSRVLTELRIDSHNADHFFPFLKQERLRCRGLLDVGVRRAFPPRQC